MGQFDHYDKAELSAAAQAEADRWNAALSTEGKGNAKEVAVAMRRPDVIALCARGAREVRATVAYGIAIHDATERELAVHAGARLDDPLIEALRDQIIDTLPAPQTGAIDIIPARARSKAVLDQVQSLGLATAVWDYYLLAYYTASYAGVKVEERPPFLRKNLFKAFQSGLGNVFDFDGLQVGVLLPEFHMDDRDRLHREDGPAVRYQDGYESYWWHGIEVPREVILEPDSIDPKDVLQMDNAEQKRAHIEALGWERILKPLELKTIASDDWGDLLELPAKVLDDDRGLPAYFVKVVCPSTGREYLNRVSPEHAKKKSPAACISARFSVTPEEFADAQHT